MIEPHAILTEAFKELPNVANNKGVTYKWGDELHLNKLIKLYQNDRKNPYPLIYNVSNKYSIEGRREYINYNPLSLVIATRNANTDWHNGNRWATSYKEVLFPVVDLIVQLFKKGQIFQWDGEFTLYEFPNYGNGKENETTDIWDALRLDTRIIINDKCLQPILFDVSELTT